MRLGRQVVTLADQDASHLSFGSWKSSTAIGFEPAAAGLAKDLNISFMILAACTVTNAVMTADPEKQASLSP